MPSETKPSSMSRNSANQTMTTPRGLETMRTPDVMRWDSSIGVTGLFDQAQREHHGPRSSTAASTAGGSGRHCIDEIALELAGGDLVLEEEGTEGLERHVGASRRRLDRHGYEDHAA